MSETREARRLHEAHESGVPWLHWGPYLSERQWGTVREDYSADGNAWDYLSHDQARSRAYRWGEDGLAGISDEHGLLCLALALWNEADPILKERLFGVTNTEGNHGEDVKEQYFYLDATPTHSWLRYLYKYPQRAYPYDDLVATNRGRSRHEMEYELVDTAAFDEDRYFDVFVEIAKEGPEELLVAITAAQPGSRRGAAPPPPHALVPQHLVVGRPRGLGSAVTCRRRVDGGHPRGPRRPRRPRDALAGRRGRRAAPLHRERHERRAAVRRPERDAVREGRLPRVPRGWARRRGEPGPHGHEGCRAQPPRRPGRRVGHDPASPDAPRSDVAAGDRGLAGRAVRAGLRRDHGRPGPRGGRVLRLDHAAVGGPRASQRHAPGAGRDDLVEAALPPRRRSLAAGARRRPVLGGGALAGRPQHRLGAPSQRRRDLHAGHVGVPLVRGLGPRLPYRRPRHGRPGLRQGTARADAPRPVPPPERPAAGVRVELRRREPAGPRLGDPVRLQRRAPVTAAGPTASSSRPRSRSCR